MDIRQERISAARERVALGFYRSTGELRSAASLARTVRDAPKKPMLVADLRAPPNANRAPEGGILPLAKQLLQQGAAGLSVDTSAPNGPTALSWLRSIAPLHAPTLLRDTVVAEEQLDCAASLGVSAVNLSPELLPRTRLPVLIEYAHLADREVVVECSTPADVEAAGEQAADLVGTHSHDAPLLAALVAAARDARLPFLHLSAPKTPADAGAGWKAADAVLVPPLLERGTWTIEPWGKALVG